ncbi:hypothetical protein [Pleionea sediminis]|uniref:hypothetical protein n=1 Tax=Pleionea sediminis TaxID=2569479 RepID=UPI00118613AB|nr:hypothetical protein [Pleionea sediminis]
MERALYTTSSNVGLLAVAIFVMPHEDGIRIQIEIGNDLNPKIIVKESYIKELGAKLSNCGEISESIELNKIGLTSSIFKITPIDSDTCKVNYIAKAVIPLTVLSFKIERKKLNVLGETLMDLRNVT